MNSQILLLVSFILTSVSQFSISQGIDTAYFLNSTQPFIVEVEGQAYSSNTHISRVAKSTNGLDSVMIDIYWKDCLPAFNGFVPFDTTLTLDFNTPSTFDLRINSFKDTNTNVSCTLHDSIEFLLYYDMPNGIADMDELELEEKQIVQIVNLMGDETEDESNVLLIYIYSDGTRKKVFRVN
ncbi:MAG: hypothetical protein P8P74_18805 [Crocinitomicaceae bacterium]|nr:hypothetical protein [Crocinitomicaceae bacterium]